VELRWWFERKVEQAGEKFFEKLEVSRKLKALSKRDSRKISQSD
jgi:hypothetical protein